MASFQPTHISEHIEKISTWNPRISNENEPFSYVDLSSVDQEKKEICKTSLILPSEAPSRARQLISENDILVATVRPNLNAVALVSAKLDGATASTGFCVLRPNQKTLDSRYLYHWVQNKIFIEDMVSKATGASYPAVSDKIIKESTIPTPKIEEQRRIAAILDKAHAIRQKRQQNLENADALIKSIFLDMFGDPVTNLKGWEKKPLHKFCLSIIGGGTPSKSNNAFYTGKIPWVTSKDMKSVTINDSRDHITEEAIEKSSTKLVPKNSVLMVIRSGILKHTLPIAINTVDVTLNQDMKAFIINSTTTHWFLCYLLKQCSPFLLQKVRAVTADNIEFSLIKNMSAICPPIDLQNKFADIVQKIEAQKVKQQEHLHEADQAFKALQQQFFG